MLWHAQIRNPLWAQHTGRWSHKTYLLVTLTLSIAIPLREIVVLSGFIHWLCPHALRWSATGNRQPLHFDGLSTLYAGNEVALYQVKLADFGHSKATPMDLSEHPHIHIVLIVCKHCWFGWDCGFWSCCTANRLFRHHSEGFYHNPFSLAGGGWHLREICQQCGHSFVHGTGGFLAPGGVKLFGAPVKRWNFCPSFTCWNGMTSWGRISIKTLDSMVTCDFYLDGNFQQVLDARAADLWSVGVLLW